METLYVVTNCDDQGEYQGVINEKGEVLDVWASNDANLRVEYMEILFNKLGYNLVSSHSDEHEAILNQAAIDAWGDQSNDC